MRNNFWIFTILFDIEQKFIIPPALFKPCSLPSHLWDGLNDLLYQGFSQIFKSHLAKANNDFDCYPFRCIGTAMKVLRF